MSVIHASKKAPKEPLENWSDFRLHLSWAYDGAPGIYDGVYLGSPAMAWLMRRGTLVLEFPWGRETFGAGQWVFPRNEDGWQTFSRDARILSIRFVAQWPTGEPLFDRSRSYDLPQDELKEFTRISERLARMVAREFPGAPVKIPLCHGSTRQYFGLQRLLNGWMLAYIDAMARLGMEPHTIDELDSRVREVLHRLEAQPLSRPFRERTLAGQAGISVSQLNKLFARHLGGTPKRYWDERKKRAARLALLESSRSIKSIALDLGFSSLAHFSVWVTKNLGKSPRKLRAHLPETASISLNRKLVGH